MDEDEDDLICCAICGRTEGDSANLSSQMNLQTNTAVRCGHQLYVIYISAVLINDTNLKDLTPSQLVLTYSLASPLFL